MNYLLPLRMFLVTGIMISRTWAIGNLTADQMARSRLYNDIAASPVVASKVFPVPPGESVYLDVGIWLTTVVEVSERNQRLTTTVAVVSTWTDESLAWNREDYGNISSVGMPNEMIWQPIMYISNAVDSNASMMPPFAKVKLYWDGRIVALSSITITTHCNFDLLYFPFDTQTCSVFLAFDGVEVSTYLRTVYSITSNITASKQSSIIKGHGFNGEWLVESLHLIEERVDMNGYEYAGVRLQIEMKRYSLFYVLCVLLPLNVTSTLTVLVFFIPPTSGERLAYLVSIYVSTALFLNFVGDSLPRNMSNNNNIPRMTCLVVFVIMESILAIAATVFVMRRFRSETEINSATADKQDAKETPMRKHMAGIQEEMLNSPVPPDPDNVESRGLLKSLHKKLLQKLTSVRTTAEPKENLALSKRERKISAFLLDRIIFWIFLVVSVSFYLLVFMV